jgi:hypothetical protein
MCVSIIVSLLQVTQAEDTFVPAVALLLQVYEERRRDSLKLMHDTEARRSQIEELVRGRTCEILVCMTLGFRMCVCVCEQWT